MGSSPSVARHAAIARALGDSIRSGELPPGSTLPSESQLTARFGVSRGTVRHALATLRSEGLIVGGRGRVPVVRRPGFAQSFDQLVSFTMWARQLGRNPSARTVELASSGGRAISAGVQCDGPHEHHGQAAARWLAPRVGPRVAWLAEQHVAAKRYLVATEPDYAVQLTEVSARTLRAQGGPMSPGEAGAFRAHPDWRRAVALREIDDRGKVPGARVPGLDAYREDLTAAAAARGDGRCAR